MKNFLNYNEKGFSLIELIILIAILGILSGFAIPAYIDWVKEAKVTKTKTDIKTLCELVSKYEIEQNDAGKLPPVRLRTLNELKGKYLRDPEALRDPWSRYYKVIPESGQKSYQELLPGSKDRYALYKEDAQTNSTTGEHPKIIYSFGPNGLDEKGKGDDIKYECRRFRYLESVSNSGQPPPLPSSSAPAPPAGSSSVFQ